jgi:hypothetical protein
MNALTEMFNYPRIIRRVFSSGVLLHSAAQASIELRHGVPLERGFAPFSRTSLD